MADVHAVVEGLRFSVVQGDMSQDPIVTVRLPEEWLKRAERLVAELRGDATLRATGRISRSSVLRLAVLRGLEALEAHYKVDPEEK
jgi:hypothetical protein